MQEAKAQYSSLLADLKDTCDDYGVDAEEEDDEGTFMLEQEDSIDIARVEDKRTNFHCTTIFKVAD